jgi:hypothetical protein
MTMIWRFLGIAFALLLVGLIALLLVGGNPFTFFERVLFAPDGRNLVKNGSFEAGNPTATDDEPAAQGNCKVLCDGSSAIDGWQVSGNGAPPPNNRTCTNGKAADAVCWIINPPQCPPKSPPCPDAFGIAAQDGNNLVDLTGSVSRPPAAYGTVSQDVPTEVGKRYELSFQIGSASSHFAADGLGVHVKIPGVEIPGRPNGFFDAPPHPQASNWSDPKDPPRFRFTAVSGTTTLNFTGAVAFGTGSDYIGLDNVSLQKVCVIWTAILFGCP